ncbi:hypothetical protein IPA_02745 [Ignicoccus pacificus DSM 13166]|uniref:DUF3800 domain-containing protein n=1 Tax=Ignicoccus pacificus DSM 13166 TaxID=940294 RepID=A0A977KAT0_9CREN|nr:hypothetical protein IPA_02745 [Ignicoccus pacificus DSM 13166]
MLFAAGIDETGNVEENIPITSHESIFAMGALIVPLDIYNDTYKLVSKEYWKELLSQAFQELQLNKSVEDVLKRMRDKKRSDIPFEVKGRFLFNALRDLNVPHDVIEQVFSKVLDVLREHIRLSADTKWTYAFVATNTECLKIRTQYLLIDALQDYLHSRRSDELDIIVKIPELLEFNIIPIAKGYVLSELLKRIVGFVTAHDNSEVILWIDKDAHVLPSSLYAKITALLVSFGEDEITTTSNRVDYSKIITFQLHESQLNPLIQLADLVGYSLRRILIGRWVSQEIKESVKLWFDKLEFNCKLLTYSSDPKLCRKPGSNKIYLNCDSILQ